MMIPVPRTIRKVTVSPKKILPQSIPNTGIKNPTAMVRVAPQRLSRRKKRKNARDVEARPLSL